MSPVRSPTGGSKLAEIISPIKMRDNKQVASSSFDYKNYESVTKHSKERQMRNQSKSPDRSLANQINV